MEWSDVRVFLAIARNGTLGAAARKLGRTQPTMGRRLNALEDAIGQKLFQRTNDGFLLTDEGAALLEHAERIEEEMFAFQRKIAGEEKHLEGTLRITSSEWFGAHYLTPVLVEYAQSNPNVTIELLTDPRFLSLSHREADVAFRARPFDESDVVSRKLLRIHYDLFALKGTKHPVPGDGAGTALITMNAELESMPEVAWLKRLLPYAHVALRSNDRDVQALMCAQGGGLAILPRTLGSSFPQLEPVDLGEELPSRVTWIGYHRDLRRLKRLRVLLDLVIERLAD
ncbi:LysR family transcriptional regulator [Pseudomonas abietaniphila]|uniref:Transcriptional regulator, LysR family n=1 Tax=Pseudomonas abietaniphila TaxID=89065 RepID=A0A1G8PU58_9PSED|nr:LysR family transcriptional regulator [Pseudomonas abietaniphila]SDI95972.1 transcriptional regulator, LysR family [Pseudomonas abietaniphila]